MTGSSTHFWNWEWPPVGPNPIHHGLDSEMFDSTDFPYTETFVREAIQNSLDARHDQSKPVIVSFHFHSDGIGPRRAFLQQVINHRKTAGLDVPDEWSNGNVRWLVVEDFNSKGLGGSLTSRTSDFWGYWLNFGLSNKKGTGRGGRGIGRVTFLIASRLQSVIGYTRRKEDAATATCGMAVLIAKEDGDVLRSTHAYLARGVHENIYRLHEAPEFQSQARKTFAFKGYDGEYQSGLGLAILYPHDDLKADGILAAAIENFAPAIINNDLVLEVDGRTLDSSSIEEVAHAVVSKIHDNAIKVDVPRYLELVRQAVKPEGLPIRIRLSSPDRKNLQKLGETDPSLVKKLREKVETSPTTLDIVFPLRRNGKTVDVTLQTVVRTTPPGRKPIDRFFRGGMCLPDVKDKTPGGLDLVALVGDGPLATYLNFCEGKAHLDLLESMEVRRKLKDEGFDDGRDIKRLVKSLPMDLRLLLLPDIMEPSRRVFEKYFAKPKKSGGEGGNGGPPPEPTRNTAEFEIKELEDNGLRIVANPKFSGWPVNATIILAYADGSSRPSWAPHDFELDSLEISRVGCEVRTNKNMVHATDCGINTNISIIGFDHNREVDARIKIETPQPDGDF